MPAYDNSDFLNVIKEFLKKRRKRVIYRYPVPLEQLGVVSFL